MFKGFFSILRRFVPPYKKHLVLNVLFNILAAFLTLFSFALIIPILEMLFGINQAHYEFMPLGAGSVKDVVVNDFYYTVQCIIERYGNSTALAVIAGALVVMTALKTGSAYLAAYNMIAIRTGVVRDIRNQIYNRIVGLPIGFFSNERKGEFITDFKGGLHGYVYLSGTKAYDPTSLIIHGNIDRNIVKRFLSAPDTIQQTSIAPLILSILEINNNEQSK